MLSLAWVDDTRDLEFRLPGASLEPLRREIYLLCNSQPSIGRISPYQRPLDGSTCGPGIWESGADELSDRFGLEPPNDNVAWPHKDTRCLTGRGAKPPASATETLLRQAAGGPGEDSIFSRYWAAASKHIHCRVQGGPDGPNPIPDSVSLGQPETAVTPKWEPAVWSLLRLGRLGLPGSAHCPSGQASPATNPPQPEGRKRSINSCS